MHKMLGRFTVKVLNIILQNELAFDKSKWWHIVLQKISWVLIFLSFLFLFKIYTYLKEFLMTHSRPDEEDDGDDVSISCFVIIF